MSKALKVSQDPDAQAMEAVHQMGKDQAAAEIAELKEKQVLIAQCHEMIGRVQSNKLMAKFADVSSLIHLRNVKESKIYRDLPSVGTWDKFCEYLGLSRQHIDEQLRNLADFGEDFLLTCSQLGVGYRDMRKLRQLTHDGTLVIDAEAVEIGGDRIPLDPDHREDLQAAIEKIIEEQTKTRTEMAAQKKAFDRVQEATHKEVQKLQQTIDKMEDRAAQKGMTAEEEGFLKQMENARISVQGFFSKFDPERSPLPDNHTPAMTAAYLSTLQHFLRVAKGYYDTATDLYGDAELDSGWVQPGLKSEASEG